MPQLEAFSAACRKCEQAEETGDRDAYYRENETFHQVLYEASGNGFLQSQALQLQKTAAAVPAVAIGGTWPYPAVTR